MKVKFQTREELINHDDFNYLSLDHIDIGGIELPIEFLGEETEVESFDPVYGGVYSLIGGYEYSMDELETVGEVIGELKIVDVDGDTLQIIGDEFNVGCKCLTQEKMLEIVNFALDSWNYESVKLP